MTQNRDFSGPTNWLKNPAVKTAMTQFRVIYRVLSNGSWGSEMILTTNEGTARTAVTDSHGDDQIRIISITPV